MKINIKSLPVKTLIGVFDHERLNPQNLLIDVEIKFDSSLAAKSDKIMDTVDYFQISQLVKDKAESSRFHLLERLADFLLLEISRIDLVKSVEITIHKPQALLQFNASVSLTAKMEK